VKNPEAVKVWTTVTPLGQLPRFQIPEAKPGVYSGELALIMLPGYP
jgi:hypothetical protein